MTLISFIFLLFLLVIASGVENGLMNYVLWIHFFFLFYVWRHFCLYLTWDQAISYLFICIIISFNFWRYLLLFIYFLNFIIHCNYFSFYLLQYWNLMILLGQGVHHLTIQKNIKPVLILLNLQIFFFYELKEFYLE